MPISKFAIIIAHALSDYFTKDNRLALPAGYQWDADNSAVLNSNSLVSSVTQFTYGLLWSAPTKTETLSDVDQAIKMAGHFNLIQTSKQGQSLINCLKKPRGEERETETTRSHLIGELGFKATDPENFLPDNITISDCDNIMGFLVDPRKLRETLSGKRIVQAIQDFLHISQEQVAQEKKQLSNSVVEDFVENNEDPDYDMVGSVHTILNNNNLPEGFTDPENALYKLIYEKAQVIRQRAVDVKKILSPQSHQPSLQNDSETARPPSPKFELV